MKGREELTPRGHPQQVGCHFHDQHRPVSNPFCRDLQAALEYQTCMRDHAGDPHNLGIVLYQLISPQIHVFEPSKQDDWTIVTGFGVDASSLDPGTSFRFEGRGRRGSVSHSRLDRVPV